MNIRNRNLKRKTMAAAVVLLLAGSYPAAGAQQAPIIGAAALQQASAEITYEGEPISLKLVNASLVDFFRAVSELSGLNILIDPDVRGAITINVEEVPWDQLFDVVLKSHRLEKTIQGNLVRISTKNTLKQEEEAVRDLKRAAFQAADTRTVAKRLNYADARAVFEGLDRDKAFLSDRGELIVDERTNTIFVTDVDDYLDRMLAFLDRIDIPEDQVDIEARIIEATTTFAREIGASFGFIIGAPGDRNRGAFQAFAPASEAVGIGEFISGRILDTFRLDAAITAAEMRGDARILSKPRVSAQNNAEAIITQGSRIPIPVQVNFTTTVRFETAALRLTVTPQITEEETVALNIKVENNVPDFSRTVLGIPTILTSEAETRVLVPDGGTTVIGGIFVETDRNSTDKVPGLGDVPVLGHLFKRTSKERETREILFFLTPKIKK